MIIGIDFDGTIVEHNYPDIGLSVPGAISVVTSLWLQGHKLILWTMRSGKELDDAVKYLKSHGIPLFGINENPEQSAWTTSPKAYCQLYIDDAALGCPLRPSIRTNRPMVDWEEVKKQLIVEGILTEE